MSAAVLEVRNQQDGSCLVAMAGDWLLSADLPDIAPVLSALDGPPRPASVAFDTSRLGEWNTGLVTQVIRIRQHASGSGVELDAAGLPEGARQLIDLAFAVKEREGARRSEHQESFLERIGEKARSEARAGLDLLDFVGEVIQSVGRFTRGTATYLKSDVAHHVEQAGAGALPIVTLISFLIGMIFAFVGVVQLKLFGAGIYTADLVAIAMVREMAAIMTAIIMAGRTGAAYAAEIGTMKVNEEVDALTTLGMNPIDFLVTPRMIALILMMPLLTMYSSLMGILGGTVVGLSMLDASLLQYIEQTINAVNLNSLFGGLFKSIVYGSLVAIAGCQQGMACGGSAMAVGQSTTRAVVMGIVLIVVSASVLTIIYINLGI